MNKMRIQRHNYKISIKIVSRTNAKFLFRIKILTVSSSDDLCDVTGAISPQWVRDGDDLMMCIKPSESKFAIA